MALDQSNRIASVTTPFGEDQASICRFSGSEMLSVIPRFELELISEQQSLDPKKIIGQPVGVTLNTVNGGKRYFHGNAIQFGRTRQQGRYFLYHCTIVPWLWFLTRTSNCRIFQNKNVPGIVQEVFKAHGFDQIELRLTYNHTPWEYCVQYRESDFDFVSRLLEQEGIYYFFKYDQSKETLVLCDSSAAHKPLPSYDQIALRRINPAGEDAFEHIREFSSELNHLPGSYVHTDYDFQKPRVNLQAERSMPGEYRNSGFEIFDYPGEYIQRDDGDDWSRVRMEELHVQSEVGHGVADARGMGPGYTFTLTESPYQSDNRKHLTTGAIYHLQSGVYETGSGAGGGDVFNCEFITIPATVQYRPARKTAKPKIYGIQTAMVTGPEGEEIYTDNYGRVKVQFHWDRYGKKDQNSSCWIRVGQNQSGSTWGANFIPRIGQEVVVSFLEGDPDQPLITGNVNNADQKPTYQLPNQKTKTVMFRSNTYKGIGYNEIHTEDLPGQENLHIFAQKDQTTKIQHNATSRTDANHVQSVGSNHSLEVGSNQKEEVGANKSLTVGGTGMSALNAASGLVGGLYGQTGSMLHQAASLANKFGVNGPQGPQANAAAGAIASAAEGMAMNAMGNVVKNGFQTVARATQAMTEFANMFQTGIMHFLGGVVDEVRGAISSVDGMKTEGGKNLAGAGSQFAGLVGSLIPGMSGIMNTTVANTHATTAGVSLVEQAGVSKVSNIGSVQLTKVGKKKIVQVGEELEIIVGNPKQGAGSVLIMKSDGTILLKGIQICVQGDTHVQLSSKVIDHN
jgi:type VI secretion system secreted protein VgrG